MSDEEDVQQKPPATQIIDRINVTLTDVPVDLHRSWKAMAALNDLSMKDALVEALRFWLSHKSKEMEEKIQGA